MLSQVRNAYSFFFQNALHRWCARLGFAAHLMIIGLLLFVWTRLPPQLPLYYSRPWGTEQIGTPWHLAAVVGASLLLFFINTTIAALLYRHDHFLGRLLFLGACFLVITSLYSVVSIVLLIS